ncbi:MAG TPA: response regulator [Thermoanaerobaculia bacterium]|nr:response regulator [Thermoanaerobaculia bacterium]
MADDTADIRLLLRVTLECDGRFEVADAEDGEKALALIDSFMPDLLVLDMAMPEMDGLEVLIAIKSRTPRPKVLAFSAYDGDVERRARNLGADDYLHKGDVAIQEIVPRLLALAG